MKANRFQFSLLGLLLAVTVVGLVFGTVALVGRITGMGAAQATLLFLKNTLYQFPRLLVWLVGGILIWQRRGRHPQVSCYALVGICGLAASALTGGLFIAWLQGMAMRQPGFIAAGRGMVFYFGYATFVALASAACWVLIIVAVLGWRGDPTETPAISGTPGVPGDPESDPKACQAGR